MRLKQPIIAVTVAGLFALAACGGSDDGGSGTSEGNQEGEGAAQEGGNTGDAQDATRVDGPVEIEGATPGGTIKVISVAGLNTMHPSEAYYQNTSTILSGLVTRALTQYVYDEETKSMVLIPDLATDLGTPNEDFTEWKFELKPGIKYEDGTDVKAEDFIFSTAASMDRTQFPEGPAYSNDYLVSGDTYEGYFTAGKTLDGFEAVTVEGNTITYKARKPFPDMPYWLTFPAMSPMNETAAADPAAYARHPMATGPYKFGEYTPEKTLQLVRNDQWDTNTDPGRTQYPDSYEMDLQVESAQIDQLLLSDSGDAQTTLTYDDVLNENYRDFDASGRLVVGGFPLTSYWAPDYRKITDIKVRQALAWAYPYKDAYLSAGLIEGVTAIPGETLMPPGTSGRKEFSPLPDHEPGVTDPAAAKALLEEADAVGYEIKFLYAKDDPKLVKQKDVIVKALEEAGFKATPVPSTVADLSTVRADPDADINVRSPGWIADWPSGSSWFPPVIQSTNLDKEGLGSNYAAFNEPAIDQRIEDIQLLPVDEQPAAWGELDEEVMTEYFPLFVTRYGGVAQAHGSKINGHFVDNTIGQPTWKNLWVTQ
ncbi:ABC transporter substrate-binding protein [Nocardioides sp. 1609]|uniref:ABC transporter substrate-binding protein n=1 Tax=Nocardioides sp. 1609 TaxID=2508327 RepID=UPI0014318554|nr:ABC transporter substrate-binding protein [Nocardioides sp. 1609]